MKVKIMDSNLIRRYGGTHVEMNSDIAFNLQKQGKVKILESLSEKELPSSGSVLVFAEEDKSKEPMKIQKTEKRIPAADEPIFPQIKA